MLKIGLTGGIGSGKSTVANYFQELGIDIIDTDKIAHALTAKNETAYHAVIERFGNQIKNPDGTLHREALKKIIFENTVEKQWLENLLHPLIIKKVQEATLQSKSPYCVIVIPLLVETKMCHIVDRVLLVDTPVSAQIQRTVERDSCDPSLVLNIIKNQATREERLAVATEVIYNDNDLDHLKKEVLRLNKLYQSLC